MAVTTTGPQTVQKAQGETVNLGCTYTPGPQDVGELDIEWSHVNPDMTQRDQLVSRGPILVARQEETAQSPDPDVANSCRRRR